MHTIYEILRREPTAVVFVLRLGVAGLLRGRTPLLSGCQALLRRILVDLTERLPPGR